MAVTNNTLAILAEQRAALTRITDAQVLALTRAWVDAWDVLGPEFDAALTELLAAAKNGTVTAAEVARSIRLRKALVLAGDKLAELAQLTEVTAANDTAQAALAGAQSQIDVIKSQLPPASAPVVSPAFTRVDPRVLDAIVTRTTQNIHSAAQPLPYDVERAMKQELIRGIAVGENPRTTAGRIVRRTEGRFNGGLTRAMTIARTETLDAHRAGTQASEAANKDLLEEWDWHADLSARTCPSCLAMHGTRHPLDEPGPNDHQNGRCARVSITKSWKDLGFDIEEPLSVTPSAQDWYENLTPESQAAIMGPARAQLLADGSIQWADLATVRTTPGWRDSVVPTTVKDLLAA
jgi:SPP1 gp7 family putative phage head morphogenesis protein